MPQQLKEHLFCDDLAIHQEGPSRDLRRAARLDARAAEGAFVANSAMFLTLDVLDNLHRRTCGQRRRLVRLINAAPVRPLPLVMVPSVIDEVPSFIGPARREWIERLRADLERVALVMQSQCPAASDHCEIRASGRNEHRARLMSMGAGPAASSACRCASEA